MRKIRTIFLAILILFAISTVHSQIMYVSGPVIYNTSWSGDTVKIMGDVTVGPGVVLTIYPGTYVEAQGYYKIDVSGSIRAIGTAEDTIVFTVRDTSGFWHDEHSVSGGWAGFNFSNSILSPDTSIFEFCKIQYGKKYDNSGADIEGGVIKVTNYGNLVIKNSFLLNNMVINHEYAGPVSRGGAVFCDGINSVLITRNKFYRNRSFDRGGAIFIGEDNSAEITGNTFISNKAWNFRYISGLHVSWGVGAAIETYHTVGAGPNISGNYCFNNYTVEGIISSINLGGIISNNLICNNFGAGISATYYFSMVRIFNNTIVNNESIIGGIYYYCFPRIYNNIVWGNLSFPGQISDQIQRIENIYAVRFNNCLQYGDGGTNSTYKYPEFTNPSQGLGIEFNGAEADWSLKDWSPCVNSGTADTTGLFIPEFDVNGNPRIFGVRIEMGCYENQSVLTGLNAESVSEKRTVVYPNPGTTQLNVASQEDQAVFELIAITGHVVARQPIGSGINTLNTESLESGIYLYRVVNQQNLILDGGKWIKN